MTASRTIFHADMDAFFASVEQLDRPELRDRPVLVGGDGPRGVVAAASYEARRFGCHSAQPMSIARRRCPRAVVVSPRISRYRECSDKVFAVFAEFTPLVEPLSIDEAFLDLTGSQRLLGEPLQVARRIKQRVAEVTGGLTVSVGVAPNKFLAKLASDYQKPDGLTIVTPAMIETWLPGLPVEKMWGVGPATAETFARLHIRTFGDICQIDPRKLHKTFGDYGQRFRQLAQGIDDRPVTPDEQAKSIGQEQTFDTDLTDPQMVRGVMLGQSEQVARRLRRHQLQARAVTVKIRFGDFQTITRTCTLDEPTDATDDIWRAARQLFDVWASSSFVPVRLIGVTAKELGTGGQMNLFAQPAIERRRQVDCATDAIVARFGKGAIHRGGTLPEKRRGAGNLPEAP